MLRRVVMGQLANETKPANGVLFDWVHQVDADQQYRSRDLAHLGGLRVILLLMFRHRANVAAFESVGLVDPLPSILRSSSRCHLSSPTVAFHDDTVQLFLRLVKRILYAFLCRRCHVKKAQAQVLRHLL